MTPPNPDESNALIAWAGAGAASVVFGFKWLSKAMREWNSDRKGDKTDEFATNIMAALERENQSLRSQNDVLRNQVALMAHDKALSSARIQSLEEKVQEQSDHIEYLTRLVEHLIRQTGGTVPPELFSQSLHINRGVNDGATP